MSKGMFLYVALAFVSLPATFSSCSSRNSSTTSPDRVLLGDLEPKLETSLWEAEYSFLECEKLIRALSEKAVTGWDSLRDDIFAKEDAAAKYPYVASCVFQMTPKDASLDVPCDRLESMIGAIMATAVPKEMNTMIIRWLDILMDTLRRQHCVNPLLMPLKLGFTDYLDTLLLPGRETSEFLSLFTAYDAIADPFNGTQVYDWICSHSSRLSDLVHRKSLFSSAVKLQNIPLIIKIANNYDYNQFITKSQEDLQRLKSMSTNDIINMLSPGSLAKKDLVSDSGMLTESSDPVEYQKGVNLAWLAENYTLLEQIKATKGLATLPAPDQTALDALCEIGNSKAYKKIFSDSDCLLTPSIEGFKSALHAQNFELLNFIMDGVVTTEQLDESGLFKEALQSNNVPALNWIAQKYLERGLEFPPLSDRIVAPFWALGSGAIEAATWLETRFYREGMWESQTSHLITSLYSNVTTCVESFDFLSERDSPYACAGIDSAMVLFIKRGCPDTLHKVLSRCFADTKSEHIPHLLGLALENGAKDIFNSLLPLANTIQVPSDFALHGQDLDLYRLANDRFRWIPTENQINGALKRYEVEILHWILTVVPAYRPNKFMVFGLMVNGEEFILRLVDSIWNIDSLMSYLDLEYGLIKTARAGELNVLKLKPNWWIYLRNIPDLSLATLSPEIRAWMYPHGYSLEEAQEFPLEFEVVL